MTSSAKLSDIDPVAVSNVMASIVKQPTRCPLLSTDAQPLVSFNFHVIARMAHLTNGIGAGGEAIRLKLLLLIDAS